ncbi:DNA helicase [Tanacetum coccineum]
MAAILLCKGYLSQRLSPQLHCKGSSLCLDVALDVFGSSSSYGSPNTQFALNFCGSQVQPQSSGQNVRPLPHADLEVFQRYFQLCVGNARPRSSVHNNPTHIASLKGTTSDVQRTTSVYAKRKSQLNVDFDSWNHSLCTMTPQTHPSFTLKLQATIKECVKTFNQDHRQAKWPSHKLCAALLSQLEVLLSVVQLVEKLQLHATVGKAAVLFIAKGSTLSVSSCSPSPVYADLGDCDQRFRFCGAAFWYREPLKGHSNHGRVEYHLCCEGGRIYMQPEPNPPEHIKHILQNKHFMENIRAYNHMFAMTSFRAKIHESINTEREFKIRLYNAEGARGYELPTSNTLGAIVFYNGPTSRTDFDVIIQQKDGPPQRINKLHPSYMSLQFPLLFIYGQLGFHIKLKLKSANGKRVTMLAYYTYQLHHRVNQYNLLFRGGRLFQQYIVGVFCCIEQNRLDFVRKHQSDIRSDYLSGLYDAISRGEETGTKLEEDSYYLCLLQEDHAIYIVCHAFEQKIKVFLDFLKNEQRFGYVTGVLYTVEFRKRGLPYCHTLLWVDSTTKIRNAEDVDHFISAELPDPNIDPSGYKIVSEMMIHEPCRAANLSAPCMQGDQCSKKFPKKYTPKTFVDDNRHVHYQRRDTSVSTTKHQLDLNNSYVVPYNRDLPIGESSTVAGPSQSQVDEIQIYLEGRFICPHKACWKILKFDIHYREPTVQILVVHLKDMQRVTFRDRDEFVWYADRKSWSPRRTNKSSIGRLAYVHPTSGELFYFRMLLCHQKGCRDFPEVQTVNGILYPNCRAACEALGLLGDDKERDVAIQEACKHFIWKTINSTLRSEGNIILVVASSCIASLLLPSGRTAHSRFKLPLELTKESLCRITKNTHLGKLLADTYLIIWDEAPMNDRRCFEAVDRSLRYMAQSLNAEYDIKNVEFS